MPEKSKRKLIYEISRLRTVIMMFLHDEPIDSDTMEQLITESVFWEAKIRAESIKTYTDALRELSDITDKISEMVECNKLSDRIKLKKLLRDFRHTACMAKATIRRDVFIRHCSLPKISVEEYNYA